MYTEDIDELYNALRRELTGFRAARIFVIICALVPLVLIAVEVLKKRLDIKRFFQGAAVCVLAYAVGGGLYAFVRDISGIGILSRCIVIFAVSCVLLAVFEKLCGDGASSFFLGMTAFSIIANTVVSVTLIVAVLWARDPAYPTSLEGVCFGIRQLTNFCVWTADYADFIVSGTVKIIFMIFAVLAAGNLKASEKLRKFVPAVFAVSAAVCCLGRGALFTVLDEFIRNMPEAAYMAAFGLAVISALLPLLIFIFGKARGDLEVKLFLKGIAIQAAAYVCIFLLIAFVGFIGFISQSASVGLETAFLFSFTIMSLFVSFALYRAVLCKCGDGKKAQSFFLGASCMMLSMFWVYMIIYYEADIKPRLSYNYMDYTIEKYAGYDNNGFILFMLISAVITAVSTASAFLVRKLYSSEKLAVKAKYILSAILAVLCLSVIFSEIALAV